MSSRRISDRGLSIPGDSQFLEFERSDGDPRGWPSSTTRIIDSDGHVNFMQYEEIDAPAATRWRVAVGQGAAIALGLPGVLCDPHFSRRCSSHISSVGPTYVLKSWPDGYRLYDHHKGSADNPRHDLYMFGMKVAFVSDKLFIPHRTTKSPF